MNLKWKEEKYYGNKIRKKFKFCLKKLLQNLFFKVINIKTKFKFIDT